MIQIRKRWLEKWKRLCSAVVYRCLICGLPSKHPPGSESQIAIVCIAALGDFITFCSVAEKLSSQGKQLTLVCREGMGIEEFAQLTGFFERIIPLSHRFWDRWKNICRLQKVQADTVLVAPVERHILSDLYALAIAARERILPDTWQGCSLPSLKRQADRRADRLVPITAQNEQQRCQQYLQGSGLYQGEIGPFLLPFAKTQLRFPRNRIAVFPGAGGGAAKRWPVERFAGVLRQLTAETHPEILVCGTASEQALGRQLCDLLAGRAKNLCGRTSISDMVSLLQTCSLVLANDSGSAHLAVACGCPTVVIGGGWEYGRFYPNPYLPANCRVFLPSPTARSCIPCGKPIPDCTPQSAAPCVLDVGEREVLEAAIQLLKTNELRNNSN